MGTGDNIHQRPLYGRRAMYSEQSSFPEAFGQRPAYQTGRPTNKPSANNANRNAAKTSWRVVNYSLSKNDDVKLKTCENAWVPPCIKRKIASDSTDDNSTEEIRKKFMSILNKISPENMTQLAESITTLPLDTDEQLKTVIDLLFQKAIVEPNFTPQYAYICTALEDKKVKSEKKAAKTSFKKLLTKCCKDRFEIMHVHEQNMVKSLEEISRCNDQEVKNQLQSAYDQDELVHRKKSVGNCRFMCELFKVKILSNGTLEACIDHLLKSPNEESLECACNILKHAGSTLNTKVVFGKLKEYTSSEYKTKISTRIRFMILDIIELKDNNWVPRNARTKPAICTNKVLTNVKKPEYKPSTYVQYKPAELPMRFAHQSNYALKVKPPNETQKDDERKHNDLTKGANISGFNNSSSIVRVSEAVRGENTSVLPFIRSETSNADSYQKLKNENTGVQAVREEFRTILDNITTENMISSAKSITLLPIKTNDCLISVVEDLFHKALDKPELIPQYVHICSAMKNKEIQSEDSKKTISFRKLLINMCQETFESMYNRKRILTKERIEIESCKKQKN
ncbi:eukaryotic translation initiation factor 4 gamma 3-like [Sipha flava]|uniref:Eukaryotic translation initiation factor 4 gamma 3-like n=1 Tax=Sipha flava TaxID=143950 RepID=A0A8B8FUZ8_9HEMI|nr:eukaryotic translation initiation factor 4 gamma 3-like [Sipha flava]